MISLLCTKEHGNIEKNLKTRHQSLSSLLETHNSGSSHKIYWRMLSILVFASECWSALSPFCYSIAGFETRGVNGNGA
jgi:hypothetical protein